MGDSDRTKLPKRIAGVKLPKKVRRKANKALRALDQPLVRNLAQVALAAASAAASKHADDARVAAEASEKSARKAAKANTADPVPAGPSHNQIADVAAGLALAAITKWLSARKPADSKPNGSDESPVTE